MYPIFIDKNEEFTCKITVEGADNSTSNPRLLLKTKNWNLMFEGKVKNGQCIIPMKKLASLIGEGETGSITLEVIVDDTVLTPWQNTFEARVSKKVKVDVAESTVSLKPTIVVEVTRPTEVVKKVQPKSFTSILKENNINYTNARDNIKQVNKLFKTYINSIDINESKKIMNNYKSFMKTSLLNTK